MRRLGLWIALLGMFAAVQPRADAKLEAGEWKVVETEFARLFTPPPGKLGFAAEKGSLLSLLLKDGESRSWKYLGDALVAECTLWLEAQVAVRKKEDEIFPTLKKPTASRTKPEQDAMFKAQAELPELERAAALEREVLDSVIKAIAEGPAPLKSNLFGRAKTSTDWLFRAAVAQLAAAQPLEKDSAAYLVRALGPSSEKDPRVRAAALDGLKTLPDGAEEHVIGRLADPEWSVQVLATRIVREKKITRAIPHLISALERANPRMAEEIGTTLKEVTGQNFEPYADVWAKWWEANKEKFQGRDAVKVGGRPKDPPVDNSIYGVPIKSDRILFIIDISGSMIHKTENPQAPTPPAPKGPITPKEGEKEKPPPPPPEEVMSGPKIDVAKHELKKAIEKLPKTAKFSVVAFNHTTLVWKESPVEATPENKEEALKWVRGMKASGSTYSDGALRVGFRIAGLGAVDKAYPEIVIDTIMFISDGAPTDNAEPSKNMDFKIILEHVREWNREKKVVINCIAVDMQPGNEFMATLARENGGIFVDR
jgi:hypothetical protein